MRDRLFQVIHLWLGIQTALSGLSVRAAEGQLEWTSADGKVVSGEFQRLDDQSVVLKLPTGSEVTVKLSSLSFESHLQALKLAKPEAFNKELIKAPELVQASHPAMMLQPADLIESPFPDEPTIDNFLQIVGDEWNRGNAFVLWHLLPPKMQQDMATHVYRHFEAIGGQGRQQASAALRLLANLAAKKRDWLLEAESGPILFAAGNQDLLREKWPYLVGYYERLADEALWEPKNFSQGQIAPWLASLATTVAYLREMDPGLNQFQYDVLSQSADRAEVEIRFAGRPSQTLEFQRVGKIWLVPAAMNEHRAELDRQLSSRSGPEAFKSAASELAALLPALTRLEAAKTRAQFMQALQGAGLERLTTLLPLPINSTAAGKFPGFAIGFPGMPGQFPGFPITPSAP